MVPVIAHSYSNFQSPRDTHTHIDKHFSLNTDLLKQVTGPKHGPIHDHGNRSKILHLFNAFAGHIDSTESGKCMNFPRICQSG